MTISDATRLITSGSGGACDQTIFTSDVKWVRFTSPGGTQLATSPPGHLQCGTHATGWYNGTWPILGSIVNGTVCYDHTGDSCSWRNTIQVVNCGLFFIFGLVSPPECYLRYCTV